MKTSLRHFGNDTTVANPDAMKKSMLEHMSGLFIVGDSIEDAIPYVDEGMVFSVLFKIRNPFFLWRQEVVGSYHVRTGDIYGFRRGMTDAWLEDMHSSALGLNFMNTLPSGFISSVASLVCEYVSEFPFVFRTHSTAIYESIQEDMLAAFSYNKMVEADKDHLDRLDRLARRLRKGETRMVRHRLTYKFLDREDKLYVDIDLLVRNGKEMLYGIRVSTSETGLGVETFVVRSMSTIEDLEKWIDLPEDRSLKFRQNMIHFKSLLNIKDFLWQRWVSGQSDNLSATTKRDFEWL